MTTENFADSDGRDPVDRLAAYRPSTAVLDADWGPEQRAQLRMRLLAEPAQAARVRFKPRRRLPVLAPVAAGVAVVALRRESSVRARTGPTRMR
ncbi:MAG: hypothetical protein ACR2LX_10845 [Jatrophihabitans sp.]